MNTLRSVTFIISLAVASNAFSGALLCMFTSCNEKHAEFSSQHKHGWSEGEINGIQYSYFVPTSMGVINDKRALMVVLHGCYQTSTDVTKYADWEETAEHYGMIVVGIDVRDGGNTAACWEYYGDDSFDAAAIRQNPLPPKGRDEQNQKDVLDVVSALLSIEELKMAISESLKAEYCSQ